MPETIEQQNADTQAKLMWIEGERRRQAAQNNQQITPDNYSRGSVSGNGVFTTSQDFGSASIGDNYLGDREQTPSYAPIEFKGEAMLEDLQYVKGLTDSYYNDYNKAQAIAQQAAGLGINIKQINPTDPNQVELRNQYEGFMANARSTGNMLQRGQEVFKKGSDAANYMEQGAVNDVDGVSVGSIARAEDVGEMDMLNATVDDMNMKTLELDRQSDFNSANKKYKKDVKYFTDLADQYEGSKDFEKAGLFRKAAQSLQAPRKSLEQEKLALDKDKFDWSKKDWNEAGNYATDIVDQLGTASNNAKIEEIVGTTLDANGKEVKTSKMQFVSHVFDNAPYGAIGHRVIRTIHDPETKRVIGVVTRKQIDGKEDVITEHEVGNDKDFLNVFVQNVNGNKDGKINSALANSQKYFDVYGNIITSDENPDTNVLETVEGDTEVANNYSNVVTEYDRKTWDYFFGDEVMTNEILSEVEGAEGDAAYKSDRITKVGLNTAIVNKDGYKSFYVSTHHDKGKYVLLAKDKDGKTVIPVDKNGKELYNKKTGMTAEEVDAVLGAGHAPTGQDKSITKTIEALNRVGFGIRTVTDVNGKAIRPIKYNKTGDTGVPQNGGTGGTPKKPSLGEILK